MSAITGESDVLTHTEGSPAYMPPEEFDNAQVVQGTKADVWAFGVTVYALAFGKLPFMAADIRELGEQVRVNQEPEHPPPLLPELIDRRLG